MTPLIYRFSDNVRPGELTSRQYKARVDKRHANVDKDINTRAIIHSKKRDDARLLQDRDVARLSELEFILRARVDSARMRFCLVIFNAVKLDAPKPLAFLEQFAIQSHARIHNCPEIIIRHNDGNNSTRDFDDSRRSLSSYAVNLTRTISSPAICLGACPYPLKVILLSRRFVS
jgi:hypothetical protein